DVGTVAVDARDQFLELGRIPDLLVAQPEDDVPRPDPHRFRRSGDALDEDATLDPQLRALLGAEVGHAEPERVARGNGLGRRASRCARLAVRRHLADRDREVTELSAAPHPDIRLRAGRRAADDAWQVARA